MNDVHTWKVFANKWLVSYTRPGPITDETWNDFVRAIENSPDLVVALGVSCGAVSINSVQRKKTADAMQRKNIPVVVISDDRLTRGIVTAISWLGAKLKAFSWDEKEKAVAALNAPPDISKEILSSIRAFYDSSRAV